jgi:hypothetical protein
MQLIASSKSSLVNKRLILFIKDNLKETVSAGLRIDFQVADTHEADYYKTQGITNFPVLVTNTEKIVGFANIKEFITKAISSFRKRESSKTDKDVLNDYWNKAIGGLTRDKNGKFLTDDSDDEEMGEGNGDFKLNIQEHMESRKQSKMAGQPGGGSQRQGIGVKNPGKSNVKTSSTTPSRDTNITVGAPSPMDVLSNMNTKNNPDDDLMAKYFANLEKTM